jgi:uncharacterized membrane protein
MPPNNLPATVARADSDPAGGELQPLQEKLERTLASAVPAQKLPTVRQAVAAYVHEVEEHYSGPLPHPRHLEHFEGALPGAANRILVMAEQEQAQRHNWETRELRSSIFTERMGLLGGILVAVGLIAGAVICAYVGATAIGIALVAASGVSMVPAIIKGREWLHSRQQTKNLPVIAPKKPPARKRGR